MTRLSNRQHPMLRAFIDGGSGFHMTIAEAQTYDQRPFRSMLIREWVAFRPGRGFHITQTGKDAWVEFFSTDITRKNPSMPLTSYFDATAYGLRRTRPKVRTAAGGA
jgi:hypothetical protein